MRLISKSNECAALVYNGNRNERSPIRSVIIRVINDREAGVWFVNNLIITDWIGWHEVLLPINQNYDKIWERN